MAAASIEVFADVFGDPFADVEAWRGEPGRIEDAQVVGADRRAIAAAQRVVGEEHVGGAAGRRARDLVDQLRQRHVVAPVAIDRVQAGRSAREVVRLWPDLDVQAFEVGGAIVFVANVSRFERITHDQVA